MSLPYSHRYSHTPFPPYRYTPGQSPHPTRDPAGHSFGDERLSGDDVNPADWQHCEPYLYGVDLFNHGFWWEAHEAWERCWIAAGRTTETGLFLQGLIQTAAACLKKHQGQEQAAQRLAVEGLDKFPAADKMLLGIDTSRLKSGLKGYFSGKTGSYPLIILDNVL